VIAKPKLLCGQHLLPPKEDQDANESLKMTNLSLSSIPFLLTVSLLGQSPVPGRLLVGFKPIVTDEQVTAAVQGAGAKSSKRIGNLNVHVVELPPTANANAFTNVFKNRVDVDFVEPDMYLPPVQVTPNDPQYSNQWHLPRISAPNAWTINKGSAAIRIAILDTGVDPTHSDLHSRLVPGWNFFDNNSNSSDVHGHGTKVAGTASASSNNGIGVTGVSWETLIMPIRVTDTAGYATYSALASGLNWAANNGARVANMSFDVTGGSTVASAAQYFQSKGGVVASSAGNSGTSSTLAPSPFIITVSATDPNDAIYSWSTTGNRVTLSAPGCVTTTFNGNTYGGACGTSFSSPIVAGVAALLLSTNPNLTPSQVVAILQATSDDLGTAGLDTIFGYGRVNAARALGLAFNPPVGSAPAPPPPSPVLDTIAPQISITSPIANTLVNGNTSVQFRATDNVAVTRVNLLVNGSVVGSSTSAPFSIRWNTKNLSRGTYGLQGQAFDGAGNSALSTIVLVNR